MLNSPRAIHVAAAAFCHQQRRHLPREADRGLRLRLGRHFLRGRRLNLDTMFRQQLAGTFRSLAHISGQCVQFRGIVFGQQREHVLGSLDVLAGLRILGRLVEFAGLVQPRFGRANLGPLERGGRRSPTARRDAQHDSQGEKSQPFGGRGMLGAAHRLGQASGRFRQGAAPPGAHCPRSASHHYKIPGYPNASAVTAHRGLSQFSRCAAVRVKVAMMPRKCDCPPLRRARGQAHFSARHQKRRLARFGRKMSQSPDRLLQRERGIGIVTLEMNLRSAARRCAGSACDGGARPCGSGSALHCADSRTPARTTRRSARGRHSPCCGRRPDAPTRESGCC